MLFICMVSIFKKLFFSFSNGPIGHTVNKKCAREQNRMPRALGHSLIIPLDITQLVRAQNGKNSCHTTVQVSPIRQKRGDKSEYDLNIENGSMTLGQSRSQFLVPITRELYFFKPRPDSYAAGPKAHKESGAPSSIYVTIVKRYVCILSMISYFFTSPTPAPAC